MSEQDVGPARTPVEPLDAFVEPDFIALLCGIDPKSVMNFFFYFSRFEHALKIKNYKKLDRTRRYIVGADWNAFVSALNIPYPSGSDKIDEAVSFICTNPVKRQKENLTWEDAVPITQASFNYALLEVPKIRNNLFHGGKYKRPDKVRDTQLLNYSVVLIKACLHGDASLYREFLNTGK
ncbi:hypothetical protein [Klebsiella quasipneumoniae]|uniref:Apea-like HEPN domain-containing protein n=1 Tax=Klebsiella quasipneumoniae TaxID=1463165 RepID=A0A2A5MC55_9ENTR|nr:hypothetical protein [Klebsiella quasipneumoniae]PCM58478.1 hypothetical protein CP911_27335 [Klebsiella quasipneumoniae]